MRISLWIPLALLTFGCQEYDIGGKTDTAQLPPTLPPTVIPDEPVPTPPVPVAEAPVYANTATELYEIEPTTGDHTYIGTFHAASGTQPSGIFDLAIDAQGVMYAGDDAGRIWLIDPGTAQATPNCEQDVSPTGMAFTPDGELIIAGSNRVVVLDPTTCSTREVLADSPFVTSGDIVGHPDGYLYWTVVGTNSDRLVRIDPSDWSQFDLGPVPFDDLFGVGYADDELFGFSAAGHTIAIDPTQAPVGGFVPTSLLNVLVDKSWWGATTNPVVWD